MTESFVQQGLGDPAGLLAQAAALSDAQAAELIDRLKAEADRHWWIDVKRSLELADLIVQVARARGDRRHEALGVMARGDALRFLGRTAEAWDLLDQAGALFLDAGDQIGWARTRIGRLGICVDRGRAEQALDEAEQARAVFTQAGDREKLMRLDMNIGAVHYMRGDLAHALECFAGALESARLLEDDPATQTSVLRTNTGLIHTNMGTTYDRLGDFRRAMEHHQRGHAILVEQNNARGIALAEINIAHILMSQGHYRRALRLLHEARGRYQAEDLPLDATNAALDIVQCYVPLNRYSEARDLAREVAAAYAAQGVLHQEARALIYLAVAEAELGSFDAAAKALEQAEQRCAALDGGLLAAVQLRRGQIALRRGDITTALREGLAAAQRFATDGQRANHASALLLVGQAHLAQGDSTGAGQSGREALLTAQSCNLPPLRYSAHLLLGRVAEASGQRLRARRAFAAAVATVERVQRGLTITLQPGFLEDKSEAVRALIGAHLREGQPARAFETLERARAQTLLGYLTNRDQLRWSHDAGSRALIERLELLREEHQWLYQQAQAAPGPSGAPAISQNQVRSRLAALEREIRELTERLYLSGGEQAAGVLARPSVDLIQQHLDEQMLLVEFYNDGTRLWAFALDQAGLEVYPLALTPTELERLIEQWQRNLAFALSAGPQGARKLCGPARQIMQRLYAGLLAPLAERTAGRRLALVPYGALHYLPLHLLHGREGALISQQEVVTLPAATLLIRNGPACAPGLRGLAHSWDGRLPHTSMEVRRAQELFGGELYIEQEASRSALERAPTQILHIAAHGEHRLDQPDLSYIQLADGQLYTDDLLQQDLAYELVVLSACETGRARVAGGDEPIGLGRGFLYAGAGALLASLWRVADDTTPALMELFYRHLHAGASKAAALRAAQCRLLEGDPELHPAFWGAFQLVGDTRPLSHLDGQHPLLAVSVPAEP
ncbi:MAG: CHAT domain-containing protein [Roseiflexaceae bacterium]